MEQKWWNSRTCYGGTVEHLMVEQGNRNGGAVEQRWWNSGPADGGTVEQSWWNSETSVHPSGGTGEQKWWKVDQLTDEQLNNYGGTVEHLMLQQ